MDRPEEQLVNVLDGVHMCNLEMNCISCGSGSGGKSMVSSRKLCIVSSDRKDMTENFGVTSNLEIQTKSTVFYCRLFNLTKTWYHAGTNIPDQ